MYEQTGNTEKMPVETRKEKEKESLVDKVRQLSPGGHAPVISHVAASHSPDTQVGSVPMGDLHQVSLAQIHELIKQVNSSLDSHKQEVTKEIRQLNDKVAKSEIHIQEQIDSLGENIKEHIKTSVDNLQTYVDGEISRIVSQINDIQARVSAIEEKQVVEFDPEVSVIMTRVPLTADENIEQKINGLINHDLGLPQIKAVRVMRLPQRNGPQNRRPGNPPLVNL